MTNLLRTISTKFYQNRSGFVEEMTKTSWCVFSVHSVVPVLTTNVFGLGDIHSLHLSQRGQPDEMYTSGHPKSPVYFFIISKLMQQPNPVVNDQYIE